jgi:hypothetical protein
MRYNYWNPWHCKFLLHSSFTVRYPHEYLCSLFLLLFAVKFLKGPCLEMVWVLLYGWIPVLVELDVLFGGLETSPKA